MRAKSSAGKKITSKRAGKSKLTNARTGKQIARDGNHRRTLSKDMQRKEGGGVTASDLTLRAWKKTYGNRRTSEKSARD